MKKLILSILFLGAMNLSAVDPVNALVHINVVSFNASSNKATVSFSYTCSLGTGFTITADMTLSGLTVSTIDAAIKTAIEAKIGQSIDSIERF